MNYTTVKKMIPASIRSLLKPMYVRFYLRHFTQPLFTTLRSASESVSLFIDPKNGAVDAYIYMHHHWEEDIASILAKNLNSGSVFIDVGANIGAFTVPMAKKVTVKGKVIAFEPHTRLLDQIKKSLEKNELSNVTLIGKACGDQLGTTQLFLQQNNIGGSSLVSGTEGESLTVSVTTLDTELSDLERIDLIKIDVEGYELEVLQGAEYILKKHQPALVIEFSPDIYKKRSKTMSLEILRLLISHGYKIWEIERGFYVDDVSMYIEQLGTDQVNIFCTQ